VSATPERRSLVGAVLVSVGFVLFVGPGPLTVLVPWLLSGYELGEPLLGWTWLRGVGILLLVVGIPVLAESIARFVWNGRGTLTPTVPTRHLVISGLYRFVRNPMYVGVITIILGEALLLGSGAVLVYAAVVAVGFHLFVVLFEEPTLRRTYGAEYEEYCSRVRRWIPRVTLHESRPTAAADPEAHRRRR
jgi:protein-S-isoprenylcysteine O-methyltransferase Ste14